jgi:hypothetical protein
MVVPFAAPTTVWYGASLGGQKTRKRNILQVFLMSNIINIEGDFWKKTQNIKRLL